MADATSTGTLILVALSGGGGALLGAVLGQGVQLHRDRKQYEREDQRHERERQQALEDARTTRRLEQYVNVLTAISGLDRALAQALAATNFWLAAQRDVRASTADNVREVIVDGAAEVASSLAASLRVEHERVVRVIYEAWPIASKAAQEAGLKVIQRSVNWRGELSLLGVWTRDEQSDPDGPPDQVRPERVDEAAGRLTRPLYGLEQASRELADLLREELKFD